jgi:hypothetical protein
MSEDAELLGALKLAREWVEFVANQCSYYGCTAETCGSKRAEVDLAIVDAAIASASSDKGIPIHPTALAEKGIPGLATREVEGE